MRCHYMATASATYITGLFISTRSAFSSATRNGAILSNYFSSPVLDHPRSATADLILFRMNSRTLSAQVPMFSVTLMAQA